MDENYLKQIIASPQTHSDLEIELCNEILKDGRLLDVLERGLDELKKTYDQFTEANQTIHAEKDKRIELLTSEFLRVTKNLNDEIDRAQRELQEYKSWIDVKDTLPQSGIDHYDVIYMYRKIPEETIEYFVEDAQFVDGCWLQYEGDDSYEDISEHVIYWKKKSPLPDGLGG